MHLGTHKRLFITTALSAVFTTTAFMAQTDLVQAQTYDPTLMSAPNAVDPRLKYFPEDFDFTTLGFPEGYDPRVSGFPDGYMANFDPTIMALPMVTPYISPTNTPVAGDGPAFDPTVAPMPEAEPTQTATLPAGFDPTLMAMPDPEPVQTGMPTGFDPTLMAAPTPEPTQAGLPAGFDPTLMAAPKDYSPPEPGMTPDPDPTPVVTPPVEEPIEVDPDRPTDIPDVGPLPTFAGIGLSSLSPPENVVLTQAVEITGGPVGDEMFVQSTGQTLFGAVMDPGAFDMVEVVIQPSGRTTTVDVSPMTGQFATRVFEDDFDQTGSVTVELTGANSTNTEIQPESASYTLQAAMPEDGFVQALSRVTYGATPQLYARVRAIGFNAYVEEQLNPDTINDAFFESLRAGDLVNGNERNVTRSLYEIIEHEIAHAAYSEKQLKEVMGAFWANHFHASEKGASMNGEIFEDREFFRENAFGTFEELLNYSARTPTMSRFLDNTDNRRDNINENYGREILELHTVGVNGGYDDDDVIAVSRVFTGWTYEWANQAQSDTEQREYVFDFRTDRHDFEDKEIPFLGITITGREGEEGVDEGSELIAALSNDARTQNYVCGKIVQKFVADVPPASFVGNCVAAWQASGGSTEAMLRAILLDPAFINTAALQRTQSKTPLEFAVSFVRAFDFLPPAAREASFYDELRQAVADTGYDFTRFPAPTGLPEVGAAWLSSSAMLDAHKELQGLADDADDFGSDLQSQILDAGLETAEEVAAFMLAVATADRYREEEYAAVVRELKGTDGFFEPAIENETQAFRRAIAIILSLPSFQLQ